MAVSLVVALAVVLAAVGFLLLAMTAIRRRAQEGAVRGPSGRMIVRSRQPSIPGPPPPAVAAPVPDSPEVQMNRRLFLNRAWLLAISVFGVAFGATSVGMLWPNKISGFGGKITAGTVADVLKAIQQQGYYYNAQGRFYVVTYPHTDDPSNMYVKAGVAKQGLMTLYQKCAHLGCRVPYCASSKWFECPCHGSKYNYAGERQVGSPAPAGLWRFPFEISGGQIVVDTSSPTAQPPAGTDTINEPPQGPHCINIGAH